MSIKKLFIRPLGLLLLIIVFQTTATAQLNSLNTSVSDPAATRQTKALFENLKAISGNQVMFGHQDDLAYGVNWKEVPKRSDVRDVCGAYPAVFGWELGKLSASAVYNIDSVKFNDIKRWIRDVYKMGSINTISWHLDNLVSGGSAWDTTAAVRDLLPGGRYHERLVAQLDLFADFVKDIKSGGLFKHPIPILFRPWHENTGDWFWWGKTHCTPEEYKQLWRFTVDYLRNKKHIHNLLYAYSPDPFKTQEEYLETYPGDDYVDILGLDHYFFGNNQEARGEELTKKLEIITSLAEEHGKVAALTETGFESIPDMTWWTEVLLHHIDTTPASSKIAYLLVWRNAFGKTHKGHFFAPYPGQTSAPNFVYFSQLQRVLFNNRLPKMYKIPKQNATSQNTLTVGNITKTN